MDRSEMLRLALEAGFSDTDETGVWVTDGYWDKEFERFAALVAAQEREACALQVLEGTGEPVQTKTLEILRMERQRIADAIRARSKE